jgi:transposase
MADEQQPAKRGRPPYPAEVRERALRMVLEHQGEYPSQWKAVESIAKKIGVNHETLRIWVKQAQVDAGARSGVTSEEKDRIRQLERENKELRRANEILKAAATFFGAELDRQPPR